MSSSAQAPQAAPGSNYPDQIPYQGIDRGIMLTAIICLIFIVLIICVLHVYARYFISRHRLRRAGTSGIHQRHWNVGLDPSALAALPTFFYQKRSLAHHQEDQTGIDVEECVICFSAIEEGEVLRLLPNCEHLLHAVCVDKWLQFNSTCPVCRTTDLSVQVNEDNNVVMMVVLNAAGPTEAAQPTAESHDEDVNGGTMRGLEEVVSSASAFWKTMQ